MDTSMRPFALLPQDREIMSITGMNVQQYREFCLLAYKASRTIPGDAPVAFFPVLPFLANLVIGVALSYAASLLAPKPQQQQDEINQRQVGGERFISGDRSAPTSAFDSVQNVQEMGTTIPLVYANRRQLDGITYGGVRLSGSLLWSQLYSIGGGQLLRALFSISEGTLPKPDPQQFAIGNNLLSNFDLAVNDVSRLSLYYVDGSQTDNRIESTDHIAGRTPGTDLGNAENFGGADVFQVRGANDVPVSDFCYVSTPSNQTVFGVSAFIGSNMPYRKNPQIKPRDNPGGQANLQGIVDRRKDDQRYLGRCGVIGGDGSLVNMGIGDTFTYKLFQYSDYEGGFQTERDSKQATNDTKDIANAVAGRQNGYDDNIQVGERYLCGTCVAVCTSRTPVFISQINDFPVTEDGGQDMTATFQVVQAGQLHKWDEAELNPSLPAFGKSDDDKDQPPEAPAVNATKFTHLLKYTEAFVAVERASQFIEMGLRSAINANINGLCAFQNIDRDYDEIDADNTDQDNAIFYTNPTISVAETRYSFFRISYRIESQDDYTVINQLFSIRSQSSNAVYNYLRFEFANVGNYEFKLSPVSGYEARQSTELINVLDYKEDRTSIATGSLKIVFNGVANLDRNTDNFAFPILRNTEELCGREDGDYHADAYARMAESFVFNEMTTSATQPEHEIIYLNTQTANQTEPLYGNIAMVGLNIRSSREITQLQQFSVYCNQGIGSTNLFPEVLLDLFTNERYGTGKILNPAQIDQASFAQMAGWCEQRKYFFDGVIDARINIRSWAAEVANNFLLDLVIRNGKFALQPKVDFDQPAQITQLFSAGNIIEGSFEFATADEADLISPRVSVRWREERADSKNGLFPLVRQVTVREASTSEDAPLETIDVSAYCTSQKQAIDLAKYTCRSRRLITHSISFETTPTEGALDIGACIRLGMESITYQQPQNGAVASNGEVTAWPPLADGSYDVLLYDGGTGISETTLTVRDGKSTNVSSVFCLRGVGRSAETYKVQALSFSEAGNLSVEASVYPCNDDGTSLIAEGWDQADSWIIEGEQS